VSGARSVGFDSGWWTNPAEAAYRLQLLGDAMAAIALAALGRGVKPLVPDALAREVGAAQSEYLQWRASLGGLELVTAWRLELEVWEQRANALAAKVRAAGRTVALAPLGDAGGLGAVEVPEAALWAGAGGLVALGGVLVVVLMLGKRGRGSA
jgi:hypothetical protein